MKKYYIVLFITMTTLWACQPDPPPAPLVITSFVFEQSDNPSLTNSAAGVITGDSINVTVPSNVSLSGLTPTIQFNANRIEPLSKVPRDFSSPVSYVLSGDDGDTKKYTVTVKRLERTTKEIVSFSFKKGDNPSLPEDVYGIIRNDSILVALPFGTTITALKPTVLINGQDVSPANLSIQDFTDPVAYTVMAEDRSLRKYTVVVTLSESQLSGTMFINSAYANLSGVGRLYAIDINTGKLRWKYIMDSSFSYPPPFFKDGIVYTAVQRKLLAIDTITKAVKWEFNAGDFIQSAPIVADNILYFNCNDRALYALNVSTGQLLWKFFQTPPTPYDAANSSSPTVVNGVVYFASSDQHVYAVNALSGTLKWKTFNSLGMGATIHSGVSVVNDKLYVGDFHRNLLAFNISDGSQAWVFNPFGPMHSSPTVVDGVVYIGAAQHFYAVNAADGTLKWRIPTAFYISSSPIVSGNTVYITADGANSGVLYALNIADGAQKWVFQNDHGFQGSPVVVGDVVFCPSYSSVVAVNTGTGKLRWRFRTDTNLEDITASPVIVDVQGKVYYSSVSGAQQ